MQVRSPYLNRRTTPPKSDVPQTLFDLHQIGKVLQDLQDHKDTMAAEHAQKMSEMDAVIAEAHTQLKRAKIIQKGDQGLPGVKGETPSVQEVVAAVLPLIPEPIKGDKGDMPAIDLKKIAKLAAGEIVVPDAPTIDIPAITDSVVKHIVDKKKLKTSHIDGFEQTLAPIRHLAAGFRGGGDTVAAGSNITISTVNGVKTISSTGGGGGGGGSLALVPETPPEPVNASRIVFTVSAEPEYIVADGATLYDGEGYVYSNLTVTMGVAPSEYIRAIVASSTTTLVETPDGLVNASNKTFTVTRPPTSIEIDGLTYFEGEGYTYSNFSITTDLAPSNFIRSNMQDYSKMVDAIPSGEIDASRTVFGVTAPPRWVVADGVTYFEGYGYLYSDFAITMDIAPSLYIRVSTLGTSGAGGGLTKLPTPGAADNSNLTFTFTQKPSFIVADGAWLTENNGYTWSGLTATFTVPPQSFIFGIA